MIFKSFFNENVASSTFCLYEFALYRYMRACFILYALMIIICVIIQISMMVWCGIV